MLSSSSKGGVSLINTKLLQGKRVFIQHVRFKITNHAQRYQLGYSDPKAAS
jgi:hypothetical protein